MRNAQDIGYGFLAARASIALRTARDRPLTADENVVLAKAATFLDEIAHGALISTGTVLEGVKPSRSIAALSTAFGPLETVRRLVNAEHAEIAPVFARLSRAVRAIQEGASTQQHQPAVDEAQEFFDELSGWLENELAQRKRTGAQNRARTI